MMEEQGGGVEPRAKIYKDSLIFVLKILRMMEEEGEGGTTSEESLRYSDLEILRFQDSRF